MKKKSDRWQKYAAAEQAALMPGSQKLKNQLTALIRTVSLNNNVIPSRN
jgi:hypothetical protein